MVGGPHATTGGGGFGDSLGGGDVVTVDGDPVEPVVDAVDVGLVVVGLLVVLVELGLVVVVELGLVVVVLVELGLVVVGLPVVVVVDRAVVPVVVVRAVVAAPPTVEEVVETAVPPPVTVEAALLGRAEVGVVWSGGGGVLQPVVAPGPWQSVGG